MKDQFDAICPIFFCHKDSKKIEQIGSGILFRTEKFTFILTVSHIIDFLENGDLLVPCEDRIDAIEGTYSYLGLSDHSKRNDDMEEMGYFKLTDKFAKRLHNSFLFLTSDDILVNNIFDYLFFTFSGYPYRKSKIRNGVASTEMFNYSGFLVSPESYLELNFDPSIHIVVKYRRNMTVNPNGKKHIPPLPHGISGGGIFAWPLQHSGSIIPKNRQIIGVAHTYKEKDDLLIGTKIIAFLQAIKINNPNIEF